MEYVLAKKPKGCILCKLPEEGRDEKNYILYRGDKNFIVLNNYPYNSGHLMVAPYRHVKNLESLRRRELQEHFEVVRLAVKLLKRVMNPQGFNLGMNLGRVAGAGIEDHLHTHIVPRWEGDTNYMPVLSDTKVIPEALGSTYSKLRASLDTLV